MGRYRRAILVSLLGVIAFGLLTKFYSGPGHSWLNNSFGGIPYEIAWILLIAWVWPQGRPAWLALGVFLGTCGLESLQLWQPAWLQAIRATLLGRLILGNTFSGSDFFYYGLGAALGWFWLVALGQRVRSRNSQGSS